MDGLIVVHLDMVTATDYDTNLGARDLVDDIAKEMQCCAAWEDPIYFLANSVERLDSSEVPAPLRGLSSHVTLIPPDYLYARQYLAAKERLVSDGIERADVGGLTWSCCVAKSTNLFRADPKGPYPKSTYATQSQQMGWREERFEEVFGTVIDARVRKELTDMRTF